LIDTHQTVQLINDIQSSRYKLPLFISTDQEGGYITRLRVGTEMPGNMALGAARDPELAKLTGDIHGSELSALGFNMNFGPVADINNNQNNPVIGVRAYSDRKELTEILSAAYIRGIHQHGIITALKHFPGHGNVSADSHVALPVVTSDEKSWRQTELPPFTYALQHGADAVMTAHIIVPALDDTKIITRDGSEAGTPATLSKPILTGILRDELHFQGLIITDAMDMKAITDNFNLNFAVERALTAGADIILMPVKMWDEDAVKRLDSLYRYLDEQAQKNPELQQRIDESARRVVLMKLNKAISGSAADPLIAQHIVASEQHKNQENYVSEQAVTVIKNDGILPYHLKQNNRILVISDEHPRNQLIKKHLDDIARETETHIHVSTQKIKTDKKRLSEKKINSMISGQDLILLVTYNLKNRNTDAQFIIDSADSAGISVIVISARDPYDIAYLSNVKANIAIYGITGFDITNGQRNALETNIRSGLRTLFSGKNSEPLNSPAGRLPVDIKDPESGIVLYPYGTGETYDRQNTQ
ncbi:glycoside hydrolase family 3 protein, partial [Morganella morganii]|nr:glycoside hydrolase family 3 protein [Morganella morganii]